MGTHFNERSAVGTRNSSEGVTASGADVVDRIYGQCDVRAAVFCGDTKGNIFGFLKQLEENEDAADDRSIASIVATDCGQGDLEKGKGMDKSALQGGAPCLVLRRQHGKDQVRMLCHSCALAICMRATRHLLNGERKHPWSYGVSIGVVLHGSSSKNQHLGFSFVIVGLALFEVLHSDVYQHGTSFVQACA